MGDCPWHAGGSAPYGFLGECARERWLVARLSRGCPHLFGSELSWLELIHVNEREGWVFQGIAELGLHFKMLTKP